MAPRLLHDQVDEFRVFQEAFSDQRAQFDVAETVVDHRWRSGGPELDDAAEPPIDDEESISEVVIRERLIEWLVGFLPGGPRGEQASL
jgi:hypothetical protein